MQYTCRYADRPIEKGFNGIYREDPDITLWIFAWKTESEHRISELEINGIKLRNGLRIGYLTDFEAYLVNLYYNGTPVRLDADEVDSDDNCFEFSD